MSRASAVETVSACLQGDRALAAMSRRKHDVDVDVDIVSILNMLSTEYEFRLVTIYHFSSSCWTQLQHSYDSTKASQS